MVHSTTKYLGGHSDTVGGFVATNDDGLAERLYFLQKSLGAVPGPFDSWLVLRGIKTLALRMRQHSENARRIAAFLDGHTAVERVLYPGLPSHPGHETARRQMRDFGGMVSFLAASEAEAVDLVARTRIFQLAESLGGVESLIEHPARMTHASTASVAVRAAGESRPALGRDRVRRRPAGGSRGCARQARRAGTGLTFDTSSGGTSRRGSSPKRASARGRRRVERISAVCAQAPVKSQTRSSGRSR